ncbi:LysR family transcriptional regulator [Chelatococcus reniformis]|uniref:Transcriptional regulator n=1 Tax=Chelatococcus reniformis TaxID=1494448 RepID=A0A916TXB6_9HYPH|nr:LysR family transcriptional regulator [Chelatococcus reniformis]GGC49149.1 transcriptional regulator [Chelatococcus reniformis]
MNGSNLQNVAAFLKVIEAGGFTAAARELGITQSTVSRRVAELERRLGRRLLERTTRRLMLTEAGERYAETVRALVAGLAAAEADLNDDDDAAQGPLRITLPSSFGRLVVLPAIAAFCARHPLVRFDIDLSDRYADLLSEGYDLAVRLAEPHESGLEATLVGRMRVAICATPAYLAQNPVHGPDDLVAERCIVQRTYAPRTIWPVRFGGVTRRLQIRPRMILSEVEAVRAMALAGLGVAGLPDYLIDDDLRAERLRPVAHDITLPRARIYLVWPRHKAAVPRVRALRDHLTAALASGADED